MIVTATSHSLFEIDSELDALVEEIQEQIELKGEAPKEVMERFNSFCQAHCDKVDRLGRFVRMMESRQQFCRAEASRLADRARATANKVDRTKSMVLFYLMSREVRKIEGREFTVRIQKNSQDSVRVIDETVLPIAYCQIDLKVEGVLWETVVSYLPQELAALLNASVKGRVPNAEAIRQALGRNEDVSGAELRRGSHLRIV